MDDKTSMTGKALERLFRTYQQSDRGDALDVALERMERAKVYFEAVEQYELRDIEAAVSSFLSGSAPGHNPSFIPPAPVVAAEVRRQLNLRLDHAARIAKPKLPPPDVVKTPESRARVKARVDELVANLAAEHRTDDAAKAKAEQWAKTNQRFYPSMDADDMRQRLMPYRAGDEDGDRDVA
jgi:hypothetical protein